MSAARAARGLVAVVMASVLMPITAPAQVEPSAQLQAVLERQAQRAQRRERGLGAFQQELLPLAESGEPVAQFLLGTMLVGQNPGTAIPYLTASAEAGCAGAAGILASYARATGTGRGDEWLERAIGGGDAASMFVRATMHWRGDDGFTKSTAEALAWAELARARSYSRGLTPETERMIAALRATATPEESAAAEVRFEALDSQYPKKPFYVCGQSVPSEG
jgi:hypothetical protein